MSIKNEKQGLEMFFLNLVFFDSRF